MNNAQPEACQAGYDPEQMYRWTLKANADLDAALAKERIANERLRADLAGTSAIIADLKAARDTAERRAVEANAELVSKRAAHTELHLRLVNLAITLRDATTTPNDRPMHAEEHAARLIAECVTLRKELADARELFDGLPRVGEYGDGPDRHLEVDVDAYMRWLRKVEPVLATINPDEAQTECGHSFDGWGMCRSCGKGNLETAATAAADTKPGLVVGQRYRLGDLPVGATVQSKCWSPATIGEHRKAGELFPGRDWAPSYAYVLYSDGGYWDRAELEVTLVSLPTPPSKAEPTAADNERPTDAEVEDALQSLRTHYGHDGDVDVVRRLLAYAHYLEKEVARQHHRRSRDGNRRVEGAARMA